MLKMKERRHFSAISMLHKDLDKKIECRFARSGRRYLVLIGEDVDICIGYLPTTMRASLEDKEPDVMILSKLETNLMLFSDDFVFDSEIDNPMALLKVPKHFRKKGTI